MNLLETVCKELGVELGEEWLGNDGCDYQISEDGVLFKKGKSIWAEETYLGYRKLITGELKPMWKPNDHEGYYTISFFEDGLIGLIEWGDRIWERGLLERGLVFRTKEEALACANKMLEVIKEDK